MVGNYLTHSPYNVVCMQIMRSNSNGRSRTNITKTIFLFTLEAKACRRAILTWCLENWMQKDKDKWPLDRLLLKKWAHSLMKWSISCLGEPCTSMAIGIKWCPSWNPLYLWILIMVLNFVATPIGWLMTFKATIFCIKSITTTLATKTWSSKIM